MPLSASRHEDATVVVCFKQGNEGKLCNDNGFGSLVLCVTQYESNVFDEAGPQESLVQKGSFKFP